MSSRVLLPTLANDAPRLLILGSGLFAAWVVGAWIGGFDRGLGLVQLAMLGSAFALVLVLFAPERTALFAFLLLPFYNISPFLSYQTFLVVGALAVAWAGAALRKEGWLEGERLTRVDALVLTYFVANLLALFHGYVRMDFDTDLSRAISRTFADMSTGVLAYFLTRFWAVRGKLQPSQVTFVISLSLVGVAAILLAYLVQSGFDLTFFGNTTVTGAHLRGEIYEYDSGADLLTRAAVEPGGPNLKTLAFLVGLSLTLPEFLSRKPGSPPWVRSFLLTQLFVLCVALLFSRSGFLTLLLLAIGSLVLIPDRRWMTAVVALGAGGVALVLTGLTGFWQITTLANFGMQGLSLGDRALYAGELLSYLFASGGIIWGLGFDVAAHTFQVSEFRLSSFNTHNDLLWVLANGGIVTLALFVMLGITLARKGLRLWRDGDREQRVFGAQVLLCISALFLVSMFHLHGIFPQYATWAWILLAMSESQIQQMRRPPMIVPASFEPVHEG